MGRAISRKGRSATKRSATKRSATKRSATKRSATKRQGAITISVTPSRYNMTKRKTTVYGDTKGRRIVSTVGPRRIRI